jgi:BirA family biotin operon repressor/biotin-[acetyl-CoA-carboxylase] ligase
MFFRFGAPLHAYATVSSTMDEARRCVDAGAAPGAVVVAESQTAGRGRHGRIWHSAPSGNLYLTALGAPIPPESLWQLAFVVGLAAAEAVDVSVRFPNDLYAGGRKMGGVLIETYKGVPLLGIGINIATTPEAAQPRGISLSEWRGEAVAVATVQAALCTTLTACWHDWQTEGGWATLLTRWHGRLAGSEWRLFEIAGGEHLACVERVTPRGDVILRTEDGKSHSLPAAAVIFMD